MQRRLKPSLSERLISQLRLIQLVSGRKTLLRRLAVHPRDQEAGVEGIAGAGGVDDRDLRRGHGDVAIGGEPDGAASPSLTIVIAWRSRQWGIDASSDDSPV